MSVSMLREAMRGVDALDAAQARPGQPPPLPPAAYPPAYPSAHQQAQRQAQQQAQQQAQETHVLRRKLCVAQETARQLSSAARASRQETAALRREMQQRGSPMTAGGGPGKHSAAAAMMAEEIAAEWRGRVGELEQENQRLRQSVAERDATVARFRRDYRVLEERHERQGTQMVNTLGAFGKLLKELRATAERVREEQAASGAAQWALAQYVAHYHQQQEEHAQQWLGDVNRTHSAIAHRQAQRTQTLQRMGELEEENDSLLQQVERLGKELDDATAQRQQMEDETDRVVQRYERMRAALEASKSAADSLRTELGEYRRQRQELEDELRARLSEAETRHLDKMRAMAEQLSDLQNRLDREKASNDQVHSTARAMESQVLELTHKLTASQDAVGRHARHAGTVTESMQQLQQQLQQSQALLAMVQNDRRQLKEENERLRQREDEEMMMGASLGSMGMAIGAGMGGPVTSADMAELSHFGGNTTTPARAFPAPPPGPPPSGAWSPGNTALLAALETPNYAITAASGM